MKIKRLKRAHRYMGFYKNNFGFRKPYQILLDGTLCYAALINKVNLREQLPKYLDDEVKLLTTTCAIRESENLGPAHYGTTLVLKQFPTHRCGHEQEPVAAAICMKKMIGKKNESRYMIATQDPDLREAARKVPGTPIIFMKFSGPLLEKPSDMSETKAEKIAESRMATSEYQKTVLSEMKRKILGEETVDIKKKRWKRKGPNPLSCKKKKPKVVGMTGENQPSKNKRKRIRKRRQVAKHLRKGAQNETVTS